MPADERKPGAVALVVPAVLALGLGVYWQAGPVGVLPRALPDVPLPERVTTEQGVSEATYDASGWATSLASAQLPVWPLEPPPEYAATVRAVELTRGWTRDADPNALGRVAQQLYALDRMDAALDHALLAIELGGDAARWWYWVGVIAQKAGEDGAAIRALERAAELDSDYGVIHARLGTLLFERDELERADAAFARAAERAPAQSLGLRGRAEIALRRGDPEAALEYVDASITRTSRDFRAHRIRAQALSDLGRHDESRAAAALASQLPVHSGWSTFDPRLADALAETKTSQSFEMQLGTALQTRNLAAAEEAGEALLEIRPQSVSALRSLASILANRGKSTRALELARRAFELDATSVEGLSIYSEVAIAAGAGEDIEKATGALVAADRDRAASWSIRGRGLFVLGRVDESVAALERAMSCEPQNPAHPLMLTQILEQAGRRAHAAAVARDSLTRFPNSAELHRRMQQLEQ